MASRPTGKKRNRRQKVKERYAKAREDAQVEGVIPTSPEGAVRDERVDPGSQGDQPLPALIGRAVRSGWAVPEDKKPRIVDELVDIVTTRQGDDESNNDHVRVSAARVLQQIDRDQWERDHPELAGKAKGGTKVEVNTQQTVNILDLAREAASRPDPLEQAKAAVEDKVDNKGNNDA